VREGPGDDRRTRARLVGEQARGGDRDVDAFLAVVGEREVAGESVRLDRDAASHEAAVGRAVSGPSLGNA
jgi:hypothetical protein